MGRLLLILCICLSGSASANDWSLSAKAGSLGYTVELGHPLAHQIHGRIGTYLFNYRDTISENGIDYDVNVDLRSAGVLLDWHPANSAFRFTVGGFYNGNKGVLQAKSVGGTFDINGTLYTVNDIASLNGQVSYNASAPYLGIGWGRTSGARRGWGMAWDLGVLYQGEPDVILDVTCAPSLSTSQCNTLSGDVESESRSLRSDIEDEKWYPVVSMGVLYRF